MRLSYYKYFLKIIIKFEKQIQNSQYKILFIFFCWSLIVLFASTNTSHLFQCNLPIHRLFVQETLQNGYRLYISSFCLLLIVLVSYKIVLIASSFVVVISWVRWINLAWNRGWKSKRAPLGVEPRTACTLSKNHTS